MTLRRGLAGALVIGALVIGALLLFGSGGGGDDGPAADRPPDKPLYRMVTPYGNIDVELFPDVAPNTVALFLRETADGNYDNTYFHRLIINFILQAGGFRIINDQSTFTGDVEAPIDEPKLDNDYGTLSVARPDDDRTSATRQFFFNQSPDNVAQLKPAFGYTVFGEVADDSSLAVMDYLNSQPYVVDSRGDLANSAFQYLPVRSYFGGPVENENLIVLSHMGVAPRAWPTYSVPFKLVPELVSVRRSSVVTQVTVRGVPEAGYVVAQMGSGRAASLATAPTTGGAVQLVLRHPRGLAKLPVRVIALPPGVPDTSVSIR